MSSVDPYATPNTVGSIDNKEVYQPKVFSMSGRIGRLRFLAYSVLLTFGILAVVGIVAAIFVPMFASGGGAGGVGVIGIILMIVLYLFVLFYSFVFVVRRLNDFNASGWLSLLMLVPIVSAIFVLVLWFMPGTKVNNNYGPVPAPNSVGVIIGALAVPVLAILFGILAAVSIPAYNSYVERAQQYQQGD